MIVSVLTNIFIAIKIALTMLLYVLAAIIVIVGAILLIPFKYCVNFLKDDSVNIRVDVTWLFGIIKIIFYLHEYEITAIVVKLFCITIYNKKNSSDNENDNEIKDIRTMLPNQNEQNNSEDSYANIEGCDSADSSIDGDVQSDSDRGAENNTKHGDNPNLNSGSRKMKQKNAKAKKQRKNISGTDNKNVIKQIWAYKYKKEVVNACILLIKRILKALMNVKIKGRFVIGTHDPYFTALAIGAIYMISGMTCLDIIADGDFEKPVFTGEADAKGKILLGSIVYAIVCFILNKHIWKIIKRFLWSKP